MSKGLKAYKKTLKNHLKDVKEGVCETPFPKSGVITLTYDIESETLISTYDNEIQTRGDGGNSGNPFP